MIELLRVPLIFTSHFYMYQSVFLSKKGNDRIFKSDTPSASVDSKFGSYKLQEGDVNGKAHYISNDGKNAIWYSPGGNWMVGSQTFKATGDTSFRIKSRADCPNEPGWNWKYSDKRSANKWSNAKKGFRIFCKD